MSKKRAVFRHYCVAKVIILIKSCGFAELIYVSLGPTDFFRIK